MLADITRLDLRLRRRSVIGYAAGMALYTLIVVALYPSFKGSASLNSLSGSTAAALFGVTGRLTSPGGWLNGNMRLATKSTRGSLPKSLAICRWPWSRLGPSSSKYAGVSQNTKNNSMMPGSKF